MFSKNLEYYRLQKNMSKKELAEKCQLTPMSITNYENGIRTPSMDIMKKLAQVLGVQIADFLSSRNEKLVFEHGEFRKQSKLTGSQQDYVRMSTEEYFSRFFTAIDILGNNVLPDAPECRCIPVSDNAEENALNLRRHLNLPDDGPIGQLIEILENKGILIYMCDIDNDSFSGMNGFVNGRPYIILNSRMTPERKRSTAIHELSHFMFNWSEDMANDAEEKMADAISGAFLFPKTDAKRELGIRRSCISGEMTLIAREYGISMFMLTKRAEINGIITNQAAKNFYITASKLGWRKKEPVRAQEEESDLLTQLVCRAVNENEINRQRGAELLKVSYEKMEALCYFREVQ